MWASQNGSLILGGELPTDRFCGLVDPGDFNGIFVGASRPLKKLG